MRQRSSSRFLARVLSGAKPAPFPDFIEPCLASLRTSVPSASGFVHELKLDGYRVQAHQHDGRVGLYTRSGLDWTNRFPTIAADVGRLPASKLVIDGEVISADAQGRPNFSTLQDDLKQRRYDRMVYYAFDLLHLDGFDTRAAPLIERKKVLQSFLLEAAAASPLILYSEHFEDGPDLYARTRAMGLEGIVSKRADAPYRSGRGEQWLKVKCWQRDRFAVIGFRARRLGRAPKASPCTSRRSRLGLCRPRGYGMGPKDRLGNPSRSGASCATHNALSEANQEEGHDLG
jgi:bifunctional non-homologous end joining protein LigD